MTGGTTAETETELRSQLYGGESLVATASVGETVVAVTSHRVLALAPDGEPRFRAAARPNVTGAAVGIDAPRGHAARALRAGVYAAALLGAGSLVDLEGFVRPISVPTGAGIGGVIGTVNALTGILGLVDEVLLLAGSAALAAALGFAARYLAGRERRFEIGVAGGESIRIPIDGDATAAADRIEAALSGESADPSGVPSDPGKGDANHPDGRDAVAAGSTE